MESILSSQREIIIIMHHLGRCAVCCIIWQWRQSRRVLPAMRICTTGSKRGLLRPLCRGRQSVFAGAVHDNAAPSHCLADEKLTERTLSASETARAERREYQNFLSRHFFEAALTKEIVGVGQKLSIKVWAGNLGES